MKLYTTCSEVRDDFSALLDHELTAEEQEALEGHLSECSDCLRQLDGLKRVDTAYRGLPMVHAPGNFEERVRGRLRPKLIRFPRPRLSSTFIGPAIAAAAIALVGVGIAANLARVTTDGSKDMIVATHDTAVENLAGRDVAGDDVPMAGTRVSPDSPRGAPSPFMTDAREESATTPGFAPPAPAESANPLSAAAPRGALDLTEQEDSAEKATTLGRMRVQSSEQLSMTEAGPVFELVDGELREAGYNGEPLNKLIRDSNKLTELLERYPVARAFLPYESPVVFQFDGRWYKLLPAPVE